MRTEMRATHNAQWLRAQRTRLGWTAAELADRTRAVARDHGETIKLSQQLVSKFEGGGIKSTPRWVGYAQLAIVHYVNTHDLSTEGVWSLLMPAEMKRFFQDRIEDKNFYADYEDPDGLSEEERELIERIRLLDDAERSAVVTLVDSLTRRGGRGSRSLHSPRREYRAAKARSGECRDGQG